MTRYRLAAISLLAILATGACGPAPAPVSTTPANDTTWVARSALYELFIMDFSPTGDLRGVINGLDRIQATGADVIWLMPIHPIGVENRKGTSGSPYAVRDYRAINPEYGTEADFRALVEAVHARGMKIILDWVPNHTAWDNVWVREHPDYYVRNARGEITVPVNDQGQPTDWTDVAQLDYKNPGLRRAMIEAMQYWLREYNIDGYRVDVAGFVPYDFWREALPALRASVPRRILLLAEWGDMELHRLGYDLTYGWDSYSRLKEVWKGRTASTFVQGELADMAKMPPGGMRLRFTTNHDETSWDVPAVTLFQGSSGARAAFLAMTMLPGRPLLYNGQEVESPQVLNLFERQPVAWNQPHADSARAFYHRVIQLARTNPSLISGDFTAVETSAPNDVIAYRRGDLVVLVNARAGEVRFTLTGLNVNGKRDLLTDHPLQGSQVTLPGHGIVVLSTR
jgi:glycosidase